MPAWVLLCIDRMIAPDISDRAVRTLGTSKSGDQGILCSLQTLFDRFGGSKIVK